MLIWTPVLTVVVLLVNIQEVVGITRSDTRSQTQNPKEIMLKEKLFYMSNEHNIPNFKVAPVVQ